MAKDSDKTTGTLGAEKAGGKLSSLLADEKEFDRRALWRIGWWATAAVGTLIVAMLVNQGAQSWRQDRISATDLARQAQLLQSLARDSQNEARQLASAIETLNSDRDRLYARVTVLEQSLDSVTGALAKGAPPASTGAQTSGKPSAAASPIPAPPSSQTAIADEQRGTATASPTPLSGSQAAASSGLSAADSSVVAPTVTPIATTSAAGSDKTRPDTAKPGGTPGAALQPSSAAMSAMAAAPVAPNSPTAVTSASLVAPKSIMGPPDPAAARLTEPDKLAKLEAKADAKADANATPTDAASDAVHKTEFAVDLGSANSISGLRALWRGLVKTNGDLARLRPIIMVKEGSTGLGMQLRLGAGPLNDAAAAAKICASLSESQRPCETTVYDGQRLATRGGDENEAKQPAASEQKPAPNTAGTPPTYQRRRGAYQQRHGAAREPQAAQPAAVPPPPQQQQPESKSEPATLSSLFRRP
jgi:hypothetical protein